MVYSVYHFKQLLPNMNKKENLLTLFLLILFAYIPEYAKSQIMTSYDSISFEIDKHLKTSSFYKRDQIIIEEEDILNLVDRQPAFGIYKDTYFTTGAPLNQTINRNTADALFQISIRQRLTRSKLPFNTFLYLTYTQKSFWNVYAESAPFGDTNYNPSIGIGKYIVKNNVLQGTAFLQIEHESNGRYGKESRSWNMVSLSSKYFFNMQLTLGAKVWIPIVDGEENKDLVKYRGVGTISLDYVSKNKNCWITTEITPCKSIGNFNTSLTTAFKISDSANQYLYVKLYDGRGESLLNYKRYSLNLRFGFCIKPSFGSIY